MKQVNGLLNKFIQTLRQLDGTQIAGVAKMLGVPLYDAEEAEKEKEKKGTPRDTIDIITDMINAFMTHPRRGKRRLLKIMGDAASANKKNLEGDQE